MVYVMLNCYCKNLIVCLGVYVKCLIVDKGCVIGVEMVDGEVIYVNVEVLMFGGVIGLFWFL